MYTHVFFFITYIFASDTMQIAEELYLTRKFGWTACLQLQRKLLVPCPQDGRSSPGPSPEKVDKGGIVKGHDMVIVCRTFFPPFIFKFQRPVLIFFLKYHRRASLHYRTIVLSFGLSHGSKGIRLSLDPPPPRRQTQARVEVWPQPYVVLTLLLLNHLTINNSSSFNIRIDIMCLKCIWLFK